MWEYIENSMIVNCAATIKLYLIEIISIPGSSDNLLDHSPFKDRLAIYSFH